MPWRMLLQNQGAVNSDDGRKKDLQLAIGCFSN